MRRDGTPFRHVVKSALAGLAGIAALLPSAGSAQGDLLIALLVFARGASEPAFIARGVGVYPEIGQRHSTFGLTPEQSAALKGPVRVEYREASENGGGLIAAVDAVLG